MTNVIRISKVLTITAKDKICFQEETICTSIDGPFVNGFYDRFLQRKYQELLPYEWLQYRSGV